MLGFFIDALFLRLPGGKQVWLSKPNLFALVTLAMQFINSFDFERCCLTGNLLTSRCRAPRGRVAGGARRSPPLEDEPPVKRTRRTSLSRLLRVWQPELAVGTCLWPELLWGWWAARGSRTPYCTTSSGYGRDESALLANMVCYKGKIYRKGIRSHV